MIVKRILRLALGPSFLDPFPPESQVQQAARTNAETEARVLEAETNILNYIGLGIPRKRQIRQENKKNAPHRARRASTVTTNTADTTVIDTMINDLISSSGEIDNTTSNVDTDSLLEPDGPLIGGNSGNRQIVDKNDDTGRDFYELDEYSELMMYTMSAGALGLNAILHWPFSILRCRIQVFGHEALGSYYSSRLGRSLYASMTTSIGKDLVKETIELISRKIVPGSLSGTNHTIREYAIKAGGFIISSLMTYPLLETTIAHTLNLGPISLREMYSFIYYKQHKSLILELGFWQLIEDICRQGWTSVLSLVIGPLMENKAIIKIPKTFLLTTSTQLLGEITCIPLSTKIYTKIASKYGAVPASSVDIESLMRAIAIEWLITWGICEIHGWAIRKLASANSKGVHVD